MSLVDTFAFVIAMTKSKVIEKNQVIWNMPSSRELGYICAPFRRRSVK